MAILGIGKSKAKKDAEKSQAAQNQRLNAQGGVLDQRAGEQYGQGQQAMGEYTRQIQAVTDPTAAARMRTGFENSLDMTRGMINGIAMNPGYSQGEQQGMKIAATNPISAAYSAAAGQTQNRVAATGNSAGFNPAIAGLARARGMDLATSLSQNAQKVGDARRQDTQFATNASLQVPGMYQNQQGLETANTSLFQFPANSAFANYGTIGQQQATNTGEQAANTAAQTAQANRPGFWSKFGSAVKAAAPLAAAAVGAK